MGGDSHHRDCGFKLRRHSLDGISHRIIKASGLTSQKLKCYPGADVKQFLVQIIYATYAETKHCDWLKLGSHMT